jgi:hypothetical protein
MKVNTKSYPHPVLGNGDDLGGFFKVEFHYELGKNEIVLNPKFSLRNSAIEELIKKEKASFVVEVECGSTFFRKIFSTRRLAERFSVPSTVLRDRVTVDFYVCANQDIKSYRPSELHSDYGEALFEIEAGDIMAVGGRCSFIAEKSFDPLRPPVSSIFSIIEGTRHEDPIWADYDGDKIVIVLCKSDWKKYLEVRGQKPSEGIIHGSIVFPVLVDAVHKVQNDGGEYNEKNWFARIEAIIEARKLSDKSALEVAQKILDNPATRSLQGIDTLLNGVPNEQEYE